MEKPILTLSSKEFQSGISPLGAHSEKGGIFFKATGVTPLFGAGSALSVNNGLLMAGASPSSVSYGTVTGAIISGMAFNSADLANTDAIFSTDTNKVCRIEFVNGVPSGSLGTIFTAGTTLTPGLAVVQSGGFIYIIYRQIAQMGRYETSAPTQTDAWQALTSDYFGAMYTYFDKILFGNGLGKIGTLNTVGLTFVTDALDFDVNSMASAISDDGTYAVIAITRNTTASVNLITPTKILFWDGFSSSWLREYPVSDPLIYSLKKTPIGLFAFGITGIWQVTFDGVKKVFSYSPGVYTKSGASSIHYGQATSFFSDALIWGGQIGSSNAVTALKTLGKLDSAALAAYLTPLLGPVSKNITFIDGQLSKGYVFMADDTPQLQYFAVGSGTPWTGVSAQTVYFSLSQPIDITHIDVVFGEPLASGDTLDLDVYRDEDNSATDFGSVSYDSAKTIRRYQFRNISGGVLSADEQISLLITFTAGAVKIKRIEVFGHARERTNV